MGGEGWKKGAGNVLSGFASQIALQNGQLACTSAQMYIVLVSTQIA